MAFNKAKALQEAEKLVSQGKTSQAIKQYLQILENEPTDLILINSIGDLYVREKNIPEALKQFARLADSYVQEGFTVKAIAIYKKITKLDPNSVEPLVKLAELYTVQGLGREAREQYAQAVDFYKKKNQNDKALELLRKIVQLDPENAVYRARLAEFCEQAGRKSEAAQVYLETAEAALRRGEAAPAEAALKKASELDPKNSKVHVLRARIALSKDQPGEAEKILTSSAELKADPGARRLLLEAYLSAHKMEEAKRLVLEVYQANPADFSPIGSFAGLCIEKGDYDAAQNALAAVADRLIEQKNTSSMMESLRQIWSKSPSHIPTLELIYEVCERTADEFTLPEILEALGHAYVQSGDLEKAEEAYQKLVKREPENEHYKGVLKQVHEKQGKEYAAPSPAALSSADMALTPEAAASPGAAPAAAEAEEGSIVKEALENSDLYARYGLVEKAVAELEKVLAHYPDQVEIHKRIAEVCGRGQPARAAQAAKELARIFAEGGDLASSRKYEEMARHEAARAPAGEAFAPTPPTAPPPQAVAQEFDLSVELPLETAAPKTSEASTAQEIPLDLAATPSAAPAPPAEPAGQEFDLSGDFAAIAAPEEAAPTTETAPVFNYEEARIEIDFYVEQGFREEAEKAVEALEEKFPGNSQVAELRQRISKGVVSPAAAKPTQPAPPPRATEKAPAKAGPEEWEVAVAAGGPAEVMKPAPQPPVSPPPMVAPPAAAPKAAPAEPVAAGGDMLGALAGDLASSLEGLEESAPSPPPAKAAQTAPSKGAPASPEAPTSLSGLLEELGEPAEAQGKQDDPETHYNLGVAFREMGLYDEAIGEFQKVVKGAQKGKCPPHYLQACTLLAVCFMDKNMPPIAAKWYARALEAPDLDEEATLALQYDLGVALERAGETRTALEKFTEVYSQNIDYRDVAEKIRLLQQKA